MLMFPFILQNLNTGRPQEFAWQARELIEAENQWQNGKEEPIAYQMATLEQLQNQPSTIDKNAVPVGSLEFCSYMLQNIGLRPVTALNIPPMLRNPDITGRNVYCLADYDALHTFMEFQDPLQKFFIKPGDFAKRFPTVEIMAKSISQFESIPGPYFLSFPFLDEIDAEWRIFFHRGKIVDARPYILDRWVCPQKEFAENILGQWPNAPAAGTLDIAVLRSGRNVLLETHQLISCGLYGFEERVLLRMYQDAWRWELQQQKQM